MLVFCGFAVFRVSEWGYQLSLFTDVDVTLWRALCSHRNIPQKPGSLPFPKLKCDARLLDHMTTLCTKTGWLERFYGEGKSQCRTMNTQKVTRSLVP